MPCSAKFSLVLQTEILSTENSDFLKQIIYKFFQVNQISVVFLFVFFFLLLGVGGGYLPLE